MDFINKLEEEQQYNNAKINYGTKLVGLNSAFFHKDDINKTSTLIHQSQ